jgi:hypothetical protein
MKKEIAAGSPRGYEGKAWASMDSTLPRRSAENSLPDM